MLHGRKLKLADGHFTEPLELLSASPVINEDQVIDQYYMAVFRVPGIAQFDGANARFGEK